MGRRAPCRKGGKKGCKIPSRILGNHYIKGARQHPSRPARPMNAPSELNFEEMLRIRLAVLRREHRDLDEAVHVLETAGRPDPLTLRRLKKQKLALKDQIVKMEDQLIPDIIA
jgi:hypothetical protein